jgi:Holliday junction resolvasome RuvABC ATP-dependent DNA helicase subunit
MEDGDVLFLDEIHMLVAGGKAGAEWLLPLLQNGVLITAKGAEEVPRVTILGATTDVQKLPERFISRFKHRPLLVPDTDEEGTEIALIRASRSGSGS